MLEEGQGEAAESSSTWIDVEPFERGSLLAAGHVRVLLVVYGIYTVGCDICHKIRGSGG